MPPKSILAKMVRNKTAIIGVNSIKLYNSNIQNVARVKLVTLTIDIVDPVAARCSRNKPVQTTQQVTCHQDITY